MNAICHYVDLDPWDDIEEIESTQENLVLYNHYLEFDMHMFDINETSYTFDTEAGTRFTLMCSGDFNNDGIEEIALYRAYDGRIVIFDPNTGEKINQTETGISGKTCFTLMDVIDMNNDGFDEILLYSHSYEPDVKIYNWDCFQNSSQIFPPSHEFDTCSGSMWKELSVGDFDIDGNEEVAFYRSYPSEGRISIKNPETGEQITYLDTGETFTLMEAIDYNHDGKDELVCYFPHQTDLPPNDLQNLYIYEYTDEYTDELELIWLSDNYLDTQEGSGSTMNMMATGDFNSDGKEEIAMYRRYDDRIVIYDPEIFDNNPWIANIETSEKFYMMCSFKPSNASRNEGTLDQNIEFPVKVASTTNYPNPFNPTTTISFSIPNESKINLLVYNIRGQKIKSLVNVILDKGKHSVVWNGVDESGKSVSSGIYFYKLSVNNKEISVNKCLLIK